MRLSYSPKVGALSCFLCVLPVNVSMINTFGVRVSITSVYGGMHSVQPLLSPPYSPRRRASERHIRLSHVHRRDRRRWRRLVSARELLRLRRRDRDSSRQLVRSTLSAPSHAKGSMRARV